MRLRSLLFAACAVALTGACGSDDGDAAADPSAPTPAAPADTAPDDTAPDDTAADGEPDHLGEVGTEAWTTLAEAPLAVGEIDAAVFDGELWTVGGLTEDGSVTDAVQIYDPAEDQWREGPALPDPVHHAALVATDTHLVVLGGYRTLLFDAVDDVWLLDPATDTWQQGTTLPQPRGAGAAAWDGSRVVYGGGVGPAPGGTPGQDDNVLAGDVWTLEDPREGQWQELGELSLARDHLDATSDGDGRVWFLAGREMTLTSNRATVDLVEADDVTEIGRLPTARGGVAAFWSPTHGACLAGGEQPTGTFSEVECIDADGETVSLPALSEARHGLGAAVIGGIAYVVLGGPEPLLSVSGTVEALRLDD
jgi:hypothetical protein